MLTYRSSNRGLSFLFFLVAVAFFSCQKDFQTGSDIGLALSRDITIDEVKDAYNGLSTGSVHERTGMKLPMNAVPVWESYYTYSTQGFPILIIPVHTHSIFQDNYHGSKLAFYRDNQGIIQCNLLVWQTDSLSFYTSPQAPLDTSSHFNGMMVLISAQDSITRVVQVENGKVVLAKRGNLPIKIISNAGLQGNLVQERDCNDDPECAKWGRSWWDRLLEVFDGVGTFFGNIFNLDPGTSGGTIFFGGSGGSGGNVGINDVTTVVGGSTSSGSGNTNYNGGAYVTELLNTNVITEELWNELMVINGTCAQSTESMIWRIQNAEIKKELNLFISEYGSSGAACRIGSAPHYSLAV